MIVMQEDTEKKWYTPAEAVEYLRRRRGIVFSVASLRNLRRRGRATTKFVVGTMALWTREELDAIQPTARTKRVPPEPEQ